MIKYTPKQLQIIRFIQEFISLRDYAPTLDEIADKFSVSRITAYEHIQALEKKKAIKKDKFHARSIEIIDPDYLPDSRTFRIEHAVELVLGWWKSGKIKTTNLETEGKAKKLFAELELSMGEAVNG